MYTSIIFMALAGTSSTLPGFGYGACYGQPQLQHATASIKDGKVYVQRFRIVHKEIDKQVTKRIKNKDGKEENVIVAYKVVVPVPVSMNEDHDRSKVRFLNAAGKEDPTAAARLNTPTRVLTAIQGMPMDPLYLSLLKKDTLILVTPLYVDPKAPAPIRPIGRLGGSPLSLTSFEQPQPDSQAKGPQSPPPTVARATIDAEGQLHLEQTTVRTSEVTLNYDLERDGKVEKVPFLLKQTSENINERIVHAKWVNGHDVNGKALAADILATILHRPTLVLVAAGSQPVDRYYLELFRDDVVTLMLPETYGPTYGGGEVPAPAPKVEPITKKAPTPLP